MKYLIVLIGIAILGAGAYFLLSSHSGKSDASAKLSPDSFKQKVSDEPGVIIDVRTEDEFNRGHLASTDYNYNWLNGEFSDELKNLDKDKTYYLYCRSGNRSEQARQAMKAEGFNKVYNIGGFQELANAGLDTRSTE